jgi:hypothetical protein
MVPNKMVGCVRWNSNCLGRSDRGATSLKSDSRFIDILLVVAAVVFMRCELSFLLVYVLFFVII